MMSASEKKIIGRGLTVVEEKCKLMQKSFKLGSPKVAADEETPEILNYGDCMTSLDHVDEIYESQN